MMKLVPLALAAILASTGMASAQYRDYDRSDRYERGGSSYGGGGYGGSYRGGDRDYDRGREYDRGSSWRGPRCRTIVTKKIRPNGRTIIERRRECR